MTKRMTVLFSKAALIAVLAVSLGGGLIFGTDGPDHHDGNVVIDGILQVREDDTEIGTIIRPGFFVESDVIDMGPDLDVLEFGTDQGLIIFNGAQAAASLEVINRGTGNTGFPWLDNGDDTDDILEIRGDSVDIVSNYGDVVIVLGGSL